VEKLLARARHHPVLKCILLETRGNNVVVKSTNLDLGIEIILPVRISEPG